MHVRQFIPLLIAGLAVALVALAAACGGGGGKELTLQEYFQRLDAIAKDADARFQAGPFTTIGDETATLQTRIDALRKALPEAISINKDAQSKLEELKPPAQAQANHDELVAALKAEIKAFEDSIGPAKDVKSESDFNDFFSDNKVDVAAQRFTDACNAAQKMATDNNISVDLKCAE